MDLAEALIERGLMLDEAEAYLESSERLFGENSSAPQMRTRLAAARGSTSDTPPRREVNP